MEKHKIYLKKDKKYLKIPIDDQSSIFLKRYSSELKYMAPWTQYDDHGMEKNIYYGKKKLQQQNKLFDKPIKKNKKDDSENTKEENDGKYFIGLEKHPL